MVQVDPVEADAHELRQSSREGTGVMIDEDRSSQGCLVDLADGSIEVLRLFDVPRQRRRDDPLPPLLLRDRVRLGIVGAPAHVRLQDARPLSSG